MPNPMPALGKVIVDGQEIDILQGDTLGACMMRTTSLARCAMARSMSSIAIAAKSDGSVAWTWWCSLRCRLRTTNCLRRFGWLAWRFMRSATVWLPVTSKTRHSKATGQHGNYNSDK